MTRQFSQQIKNLSNSARWGIAAIGAFLLLGFTVMCSMTGLLMMTFATDACSRLPDWVGIYVILPPAMMALGSLLAPLLFALRQRWIFILSSFVVTFAISIILYIGWLPIVSTQC